MKEGPCFDAVRAVEPVHCADLNDDSRGSAATPEAGASR